jgi:pimeloyl-ACP methyl ester carboxylesterase
LAASGAGAQSSLPVEQVSYRNHEDSTYLTATLTLPSGPGPHAGVVLLSIAGTQGLVERLAAEGYAVLLPGRRGFVEVEPLLQATYANLGADAQAAVEYLRGRADVEDGRIAMIAQADDAPAGMLASADASEAVPLVLLAPPGFPGRDVFRLEQRNLAEVDGRRAPELDALDRFVDQIADAVLSASLPNLRSYRLQALMGSSNVRLPYNAAFPNDERQIHFFASPLWYDRIAFEPEAVLARLHAPVLVMIGNEDPNTPLTAYLAAVRRGLSGARTRDWTVCLIEGRARHSFTSVEVDAIVAWLGGRVAQGGGAAPRPTALQGCLPDPPPR